MNYRSTLIAVLVSALMTFAAYGQLVPVTLPLYENFEGASGSYTSATNCIHCDSLIQFDARFQYPGNEISFNYGYSNTFYNSQDSVGALLHSQNSVSYLRATIDMSNYDTSDANIVLLSFFHYSHYDEPHFEDAVYARGTDSSAWIRIYDLAATGVDAEWVEARNINISEYFKNNNQNFSSTFQLRFGHLDNDFNIMNDGRSIDDISLEEVSCVPPSGLNPVTKLDTSMTFSWRKASANVQTEFWYGTTNFRALAQSGYLSRTNKDTLVINNLNPGTCYEFWYRHICGSNDSSKWVGPFEYCTNCPIQSLPYYTSFDTLQPGQRGRLGNCWTSYTDRAFNHTSTSASLPYQFETNMGVGPLTSHGPYYHAGTGVGGYVTTLGSTIYTNDTAFFELNTPMDLSGSVNPVISFSYHILNSLTYPGHKLAVQVDSGLGWQTIAVVNKPDAASRVDAWQDTTLSLGSYQGLVRVRFLSEQIYGVSHVALDEIGFHNAVTCFEPTNLIASNISSTSADIYFDTISSPTISYELSYVAGSGNPSLGTKISVTGHSATLTGLTPGTNYCVYARAICSISDTSKWSYSTCFSTQCTTLTQPYSQSFDITLPPSLPSCWTGVGATPNFTVALADSTDTGVQFPSSPYGVEINDGPFPLTMLVGPAFSDLKSGLNQVRFKLAYEYPMSSFPRDTLYLGTVVSPDSPATFVKYDYIDVQPPYNQFREYTVEFTDSSLLKGGEHIAFAYSNSGNGTNAEYYIDDFYYESISPCSRPSTLAAIDSGCQSITLSWGPSNGNSILYFQQLGNTGFWGLNDTISFISSPYTVSGLNSAKQYRFYVADTCGRDTSAYLGTVVASPDYNIRPRAKISVLKDSTYQGVTHLELDGEKSYEAILYNWDFGNGSRAFTKKANTTYTQSGPVTITLAVRNDCSKWDTTQMVYQVIGLQEAFYDPQLRIFPNPTSEYITIEMGEGYRSYESLQVVNSIGQVVDERNLGKTRSVNLNLGGVKGFYTLRLFHERGVINERIIKN